MRVKPVAIEPLRHLYPYESHFMTVSKMQYHYLDEGQGPLLVMVHGNPTWSFYYRRLINAFKDRYRILVPDHFGCGLSDKPSETAYDFRLKTRVADFTTFLDRVAPGLPLTLIVHDWGGMIGLAWALEHLDRLNSLVITNTAGFFPPNGQPISVRLRLLRKPNPLMDRLVLNLNLFARAALVMAPYRRLPRDVRTGLIAPYNCRRHRLATLKFVQDIPLSPNDPSGPIVARVSEQLHRLDRIPTTVVWGARDFVFTRAYFEEWQRRLPGAEFKWLSEAGHYLLEDQPGTIISHITEFLYNHSKQ